MTPKILILADQRARRISHMKSIENIRPNSEFILVKSFQQALEAVENNYISLIVLDPEIDDSPNHRTRSEAIAELKHKSNNIPIIAMGLEAGQLLSSLKDGVDGFIPSSWLV